MLNRSSGQSALLLALVGLVRFAAAFDGIRGEFVAEFALPAEPLALRIPTSVAVGADGNVYVLDGVHNRVVVFQADGTVASIIAPTGEAALLQPIGLFVAVDGRIWIADSGNGRIVVCSPDGAVQQLLTVPAPEGGGSGDPTHAVPSSDGAFVWVADNDHHRLLRHDLSTGEWRVLGGPGEGLGQWDYPFHIAIGPTGQLFVSDVLNARVQVLRPDGEPERRIGSYGVERGQFFRPGGVAVDLAGNVWVADSVTGLVQALRPDGSPIDVLRSATDQPLHFAAPLGLAFDRRGSLYVVESRANRVRKLTLTKTTPVDLSAEPVRRPRPGQQPKACTICHYDWLAPFSDGRDSSVVPRPIGSADDPVVSRSEICLSCHDGTLADSRRLVWDEHGHRTGITPPKDMTVPEHLPLTDGKLACRTCHSAHTGDVPQGDFRRAVALRVPNPSSELCASCHTDKTRGPRFGTHPTGGMPWAIPDPLVAAGAKVGPNARELTCQVCHTPHGAKYDHLLVMGVESNQLCLTCHEQMRPGMFRDSGQTEHPLTARLNAEQLAAVHALDTRVGPDNQLVCLSCHKLHHGKGGRFLLADDLSDGQMCLRCHSARREILGSAHDLRTNFPAERNRLGMTVADGGACSACHLFHRYAREPAPGPGDAAGHCLSCHREGACAENKRLSSINHPSVRCTECHNPHQTQFGQFLRERTDDLCARCHTDKMQMLGGPHDSSGHSAAWCDISDRAGERCLSCHRPHGDELTGPYRVPADASNAGPDGACITCHGNVSPGGPSALLHPQTSAPLTLVSGLPLTQHPDGSQNIGCGTCHDPHGGPSPVGGLLRSGGVARGVDLCVRCHTDMTQIVVTAHSPEAMRSHGLDSAACQPCHQVHGDATAVSQSLLWPKALLAAGETSGDAHCLGCHRTGGTAHPPAIATHPDVQMFNVQPGSATSLPLFDSSGQPADFGKIGCRTCHLPHGRPMPDLPVTAERTPEIRAQRIQLRAFEPPNACTACHSVDALRRFLYFHDPARRGAAAAER